MSNQIDFSKLKFRCSELPYLMKKGRKKDELSETTKTFLKSLYVANVYSRKKLILTKEIIKGVKTEPQAISLYRATTQNFVVKNETIFSNDYLIGIPDLILENKVVDIKTSYDIWSFFTVEEKDALDNYYWQLVGYCLLTGKTNGEIAYCLVDTPKDLVEKEANSLMVMADNPKEQEQIYFQVLYNHTYDDIPEGKRVKIFSITVNLKEAAEELYTKLEVCRKYLANLDL